MCEKIEEKIINELNKNSSPCQPDELFALVYGDDHEKYGEFFSCVNSLERSGKLIFTKKGKITLPEKAGLLRCTFRSSSRGFGFASPEDGKDIFIPKNDTQNAFEGDIVLVGIKKGGKKFLSEKASEEGYIYKITEHSLKKVTGTLFVTHSRKKRNELYYVVPDNKKINAEPMIYRDDLQNAVPGDKVEVEITVYPDARHGAMGKIVKVFGECDSKEANYASILNEHGINTEFPEDVIKEAKDVCDLPFDISGRADLRNMLIFTIDGADSKDLDDAISVEKTKNGYILGVHIADVSHYVTENSGLDEEALSRATSVYFTDKVVPMLPKELSNGICSLNQNEDRYALSAFMTLDGHGEILDTEIKESVINSKIRGVYSELNDVIEKGKESLFFDKYSLLADGTLDNMLNLFSLLEKKSRKRGMLDLESTESKILLGDNGEPKEICRIERGITEQVIEQFMLCANEAVATWMYNMDMPCVYRIHEDPDEEKIHGFAMFAQNLGVNVAPLNAKNIYPSSIQKVIEDAEEKNVANICSKVLLRCLMKARYSQKCSRHFGLSLERYCHFTSPIRRYPDLATHRTVKLVLHGMIDENNFDKYHSFVQKAALISSEREKEATGAERDIDDLYKAIYMQNFIGESFDGVITSVTGFGFFAELPNTCEGLVPVTSLDGYYEFDEKTLSLYKGKSRFTLGQKVRIKVKDSNIITRRIEFVLE